MSQLARVGPSSRTVEVERRQSRAKVYELTSHGLQNITRRPEMHIQMNNYSHRVISPNLDISKRTFIARPATKQPIVAKHVADPAFSKVKLPLMMLNNNPLCPAIIPRAT